MIALVSSGRVGSQRAHRVPGWRLLVASAGPSEWPVGLQQCAHIIHAQYTMAHDTGRTSAPLLGDDLGLESDPQRAPPQQRFAGGLLLLLLLRRMERVWSDG